MDLEDSHTAQMAFFPIVKTCCNHISFGTQKPDSGKRLVEDSRDRVRGLLARAIEFHGHLGPFLVLGLRMGALGHLILKPPKPNDLTATMFVTSHPPESCTIDGVQVSSGCTLGKGTIRISASDKRVACRFRVADRTCTIGVKTEVLKTVLGGLNKATDKQVLEIADSVSSSPDDELFKITSSWDSAKR